MCIFEMHCLFCYTTMLLCYYVSNLCYIYIYRRAKVSLVRNIFSIFCTISTILLTSVLLLVTVRTDTELLFFFLKLSSFSILFSLFLFSLLSIRVSFVRHMHSLSRSQRVKHCTLRWWCLPI